SSKANLKRIALEEPGRGRGVGSLRAVQRHVFERLKKFRLSLDCYADNHRAIRLYEKTGFTREGELRQATVKRNGTRASLVLFGLLADEYRDLIGATSENSNTTGIKL
ncbi:MAG: GNAT family protein, partial [Pseudomonadota bacterium]